MRGLIKKDLLLIKGNIKVFIIMLIVFLGLSLNGNESMLYALPIISVMLSITTFSYDEYNKWDAYAISLPQTRKNIVRSKYITGLLLIVVSVIVTLGISCIVSIVKNNFEMKFMIESLLGIFVSSTFIIMIMYPLIYKFGCEKGRIVLFALAFLISGLVGLVGMKLQDMNIDVSNIIGFLDKYGLPIIIAIDLIGLQISYKISEKIYSKKDF